MSAQDLGTLSDYILNGDNYTRVDPATGNTLVIPGQQNSTGKPLLAPNSECNAPDCYYPVVPSCTPDFGFSGRCDLVVHDRITGWYHIAAFSDFQTIDVTCECSLAGAVTGFQPPTLTASGSLPATIRRSSSPISSFQNRQRPARHQGSLN